MRAKSRLRWIRVKFSRGSGILGNLPLLTEALFRALITGWGAYFRYHFSSRATGLFWPDVMANSYSRLATAMAHFWERGELPNISP